MADCMSYSLESVFCFKCILYLFWRNSILLLWFFER